MTKRAGSIFWFAVVAICQKIIVSANLGFFFNWCHFTCHKNITLQDCCQEFSCNFFTYLFPSLYVLWSLVQTEYERNILASVEASKNSVELCKQKIFNDSRPIAKTPMQQHIIRELIRYVTSKTTGYNPKYTKHYTQVVGSGNFPVYCC